MLKITKSATELKGLKLALLDGKNVIPLGTFDAIPQVDDKGVADPNNLTLHFVHGNKWAGELVADLNGDMGLYFKGSIYSRKTALSRGLQSVGSL